MKKILITLLFPIFILSQNEYKYDVNSSNLPNWVKEMYKENPNPGKVEALYKEFYKKNDFNKNKHTQYYKRWIRSINRDIGKYKRPYINDLIDNYAVQIVEPQF